MAVRSFAGGLALLVGIPAAGGVAAAPGQSDPSPEACADVVGGSPRGGLSIKTRPSGGPSVRPGSAIEVQVGWNPGSLPGETLHKAVVCVTVGRRLAPKLSTRHREATNTGRFRHRFRLPADVPAGTEVCAVALVAGRRPDDGFDRKRSESACLTVATPRPGAGDRARGPGGGDGPDIPDDHGSDGGAPETGPSPGLGGDPAPGGAAPTAPIGSGSGPGEVPRTGAGPGTGAPVIVPGPGGTTGPVPGPAPPADPGPAPAGAPASAAPRRPAPAVVRLPAGRPEVAAPAPRGPASGLAATGGSIALLSLAGAVFLVSGRVLTRLAAARRPTRAERRARLMREAARTGRPWPSADPIEG